MAFTWEDITGGIGSLIDTGSDWLSNLDSDQLKSIATLGGGVAGAMGLFDPETQRVGYQGKIPRYSMVRDKVPGTNDPERRPGSSGQRYLTRPRFVEGDTSAARAESQAEAQQLSEENKSNRMAQGGLASIQRFANGGMPQAPKMPMLQQAQQSMGMPKQAMGAMKPQGMQPQAGAMNPMKPKPPMPQGMGGAPKPPMPQMPQMAQGMGGAPKPPMPPMPPQAPAKQSPEDILNQLASTGKVAPPAPAAPPMPMPQPTPQLPGVNPMATRKFAGGGIANMLPQQAQQAMPQQAQQRMPQMPQQAAGQPRFLGGATDGMADRVPASIDGQEQAALSDGEFVIPADVVSHLGNGNSQAGADQLYGMMDRIRQARTGKREQARPINPQQMMPRG